MEFLREIEKKFVVGDGVSMQLAATYLETLYPDAVVEHAEGADTFWALNGVDFIRLRSNTNELTVKITDTGTIEDRVEENLRVKSLVNAHRWACAAFGQPAGVITKRYVVFDLPTFTISLYKVVGYSELFLEVEADNLEIVDEVAERLGSKMTLDQEFRSLYQICFDSTPAFHGDAGAA